MAIWSRRVLIAVGLLFVGIVATAIWKFWSDGYWWWPFTTDDRGGVFRLVAEYQLDGEIVSFDIVAACMRRPRPILKIEWGAQTGSTVFPDPPFIAKATKRGSVLMQLVPAACEGQTTANKRAPKDLLPGAILFDNPNDLTLGTGYFSQTAFESPYSKVRFMGARIETATMSDWRRFQETLDGNLVDHRPYWRHHYAQWPPMEKALAAVGDKSALREMFPRIACWAVLRHGIERPEDRRVLEQVWPPNRPRFWSHYVNRNRPLYDELAFFNEKVSDGNSTFQSFQNTFHFPPRGFATRSRGGVLDSAHRPHDLLPATFYPLRHELGVPWLDKRVIAAKKAIASIDLDRPGFAYCYAVAWPLLASLTTKQGDGRADIETRIGGERIEGEAALTWLPTHNLPHPFYERTDSFFMRVDIHF